MPSRNSNESAIGWAIAVVVPDGAGATTHGWLRHDSTIYLGGRGNR